PAPRTARSAPAPPHALPLLPPAPTACPFEIILRPDRKFDIIVGGEIYEDQPFDALTDIPQMVRSISNGRVLIRRWRGQATGILYSTETLIDLPGPNEGHIRRPNPDAPSIEGVEEEAEVEAYATYRRRSSATTIRDGCTHATLS